MATRSTTRKAKTTPARAAGKPSSSRKPSAGTALRKPAPRAGASAKISVKVRMYALGVGDCFLLRFYRGKALAFTMAIDCGVHQSQPGGKELVQKAVEDLAKVTRKKLDVLAITHEHLDHVSGFSQAQALWDEFEVGELWASWTEDASDPLAKKLLESRQRGMRIVGAAAAALAARGGDGGAARSLSALVGFFGDTTGAKLAAAGDVLRGLANRGGGVAYRKPGEPPLELPGNAARIYVLGPPRSAKALADLDGQGDGQTYGLALAATALAELEATYAAGDATPFDDRFAIPLGASRALPFFQARYWSDRAPGAAAEREEPTQRWRRIDLEWLESPHGLALKLDEQTNNTSLVLAIELGPPDQDGPVLLFVGDAQIGSWASWSEVAWDYRGRHVTGADLLSRTVLYKVGHHGSHNATLREGGLETMKKLRYALVPTDPEMAEKVGWKGFPCQPLLDRLEDLAKTGVVRTDRDVDDDPGYWEKEIQGG